VGGRVYGEGGRVSDERLDIGGDKPSSSGLGRKGDCNITAKKKKE